MCRGTSCFPLTPADVGATLLVKNTFADFVSASHSPATARRSRSLGVCSRYQSDEQLERATQNPLDEHRTPNTVIDGRRGLAQQPHAASPLPRGTVTLMIRRVPRLYTQEELKLEIESAGFQGCFDFLYLPADERHKRNRGFAFVNFVDSSFAARFQKSFHNQRLKIYQARHPLEVIAAELQGLDAISQHFAVQKTTGQGSRGKPLFFPGLQAQTITVFD